MKKLYFYTKPQLITIGDFKETNGWKDVYVFSIEGEELKLFVDLEIFETDNTIEAINQYLEDNGYNGSEFELIEI